MDAHFRAFSFVDRISAVRNGTEISGRYTIPRGLADFPIGLVGEAVGQLAAWAAMAAVHFTHRPVAGLAGRVDFFAGVRPGQVLELAARLEHVDTESVAYSGTAHAEGKLLIQLEDCVGPMMPLAELDDPPALVSRFQDLCGHGVASEGFPGLPPLVAQPMAGEPGRQARATFHVPVSAPFFADHFPHRPVFPGTLLMHLSFLLAARLASELAPPAGGRWGIGTVLDMKLRAFVPPGAVLGLEVKLKEQSETRPVLALEARAGAEVVATARLLLRPEADP
jgi:3-hydroxymyristoyl/3-hydroxydecanoyl-(acyl carrier protein) dehydratase